MEALRQFVKNSRNSAIVVGALLAVALLGCCLIGFYAFTPGQPSRTEVQETTAVVTEATATGIPIEEPTNTTEPTDTPEPTETRAPSATPTLEPTATLALTETPTDTAEPTDTPQPTNTSPPSPTPTPEPTPTRERVEAQVVEVVDGDTIKVSIGGEVHTLRYIGIDSPESQDPNEPVEWMGPEATEANRDLVGGKTVYLEKDVSETDQYGRLLRYVFLVSGTFVNAELVRQGYAQAVSYPPDVKYQELLVGAQEEARENGRGLWAAPTATSVPPTITPPPASPTAPPSGQARVVVDPSCCQFNSPGNDNDTKDQEYVCFANTGQADADMTGWAMRDEYGWEYRFPSFVLPAGARVRVATGCGTNTSDMLFWCKDGTAVWNNGGDTVFLYDGSGALVATHEY
jgi:endonuclease YncB( thermonuclease family)